MTQIGKFVEYIYLSGVVFSVLSRSYPRCSLGINHFLPLSIGVILISTSLAVAATESSRPTAAPTVNEQPSSQSVTTDAVVELPKEIVEILQNPDVVESYRVQPELDHNTSGKCQLAGFRVVESGPKLTAEQIEQFKMVVLDSKNYSVNAIKKCVFRPEFGLLFKKGQQQVEFLLSTGCDKWLFVHAEQEKQGDYRDSAKPSLLELRDTLFPAKSD